MLNIRIVQRNCSMFKTRVLRCACWISFKISDILRTPVLWL